MMMFSYKFVIWPALVCIPVFTMISMAVPGIAMKKIKNINEAGGEK